MINFKSVLTVVPKLRNPCILKMGFRISELNFVVNSEKGNTGCGLQDVRQIISFLRLHGSRSGLGLC